MAEVKGQMRAAYSIAEFAAMIDATPSAVYMRVYRGAIPSVRVGGRVMIPASYVEAVREGRVWEGGHHEGLA